MVVSVCAHAHASAMFYSAVHAAVDLEMSSSIVLPSWRCGLAILYTVMYMHM